jgi:hypothetical protein
MVKAGDVISYLQMCAEENTSFRRGMNFGRKGKLSVILMSTRPGAPYKDRVEENGRVLIYEGHDNPVPGDGRRPKEVDQESRRLKGVSPRTVYSTKLLKNTKRCIRRPK